MKATRTISPGFDPRNPTPEDEGLTLADLIDRAPTEWDDFTDEERARYGDWAKANPPT